MRTTLARITALGVLALLVTCTGAGPRAPEDRGAVRPEGIEQRMLDAAKQVARGESPQELVDRSLGVLDRESDEETRRLRLVSDTLPLLRRIAAGERNADADARLTKLTAQVARRYHLDDQEFERVREWIERVPVEDNASLHSRLDAARVRRLERVSTLHQALGAVLEAVEGSDAATARESAAELADSLESLDGGPEILGSELSYIESPLTAGAPAAQASVTPAYLDSTGGVVPVVDDIRSAEEVEVSAEIQGKADELDGDPVAIYEYVKNGFDLDLYAGVLKGAPDTFRQRRGGPADLAAVLIALFRAADIPARYVTGTIQLGKERIGNIAGASDDATILRALSSSGIEYSPVNKGGRLAAVEMSHVWVEAYVPYGHYRGVPLGQASKEWVPLDPGIAGTPRVQPTSGALADPFSELGISAQAAYDDYLSTVQTALPLAKLHESLDAALVAQGQGLTYEQLLDSRSTASEALGALPSTLPYEVVQVTGEYDFLPEEQIQTLRIVARQGAVTLLDHELAVHQVVGHRVVITYAPATELDEATILSFGGMLQTPPYLANVVPIIRVDGKEVARGEAPTPLAEQHDLILEVHSAGFVRRIQNRGTTGNIYALALGAPRNDFAEPDEYIVDDQESQAGILLSDVARSYVNAWTAGEEELARLLGLSLVRPLPSEVLVSNDLKVVGELGAATGLEWRGVKVDADLRAASMLTTRAGASSSAADDLRLLCGLQGSALEHQLLTDAFQVEAISADKALAAARDAGIAILTIDSTNLATQLGQLDAGRAVVDEITDRVNRGQVVTVHATPVTRQDWTGTGFVARDPESGEVSYLLSGEVVTSGGLTIVQPSGWPPLTAEQLSNADRLPSVDITQAKSGFFELLGSDSIATVVGTFDPSGPTPRSTPTFRLRVRSEQGRLIRGATVRLETEPRGGKPRCFTTAAQAEAFAATARSTAEQIRQATPAGGQYLPASALNELPALVPAATTGEDGIATFFCVADPVTQNAAILSPHPARPEILRQLGFGLMRPVWTNFPGANQLAYPGLLNLIAEPEAPAFIERWTVGSGGPIVEPVGLVTDTVFGVRLKDLFGNHRGGDNILWSSSTLGDVVVDPATTALLAPEPLGVTLTDTDAFSFVRLYLSEVGATHTLTGQAGEDPSLAVLFEIQERGTSQDVEIRLQRDPSDQGFQAIAGTISPVTSRFAAFARDAGGVWSERDATLAVVLTEDPAQRNNPIPLAVPMPLEIATNEPFNLPLRPELFAEQVLMYRPTAVAGVDPQDLPQLYDAGAVQRVATPVVEIERLRPAGFAEPILDGGLALLSDLATTFLVRNPADYPLAGRMLAVADDAIPPAIDPPPEIVPRHASGGFLLSPTGPRTAADFANEETWYRTSVPIPMLPTGDPGTVQFDVLTTVAPQVAATASVLIGRAEILSIDPEHVFVREDGRPLQPLTVQYALELPAAFLTQSVSIEVVDSNGAVALSSPLDPAASEASYTIEPTSLSLDLPASFIQVRLAIESASGDVTTSEAVTMPVLLGSEDNQLDRVTPFEPATASHQVRHNGEVIESYVDLALAGRLLDFGFVRTYRSQNLYEGPFGLGGWDHNLNARLVAVWDAADPDETTIYVRHYDGAGRRNVFRGEAHDYAAVTRGLFVELSREGGDFVLTDSEGTKQRFEEADDPWAPPLPEGGVVVTGEDLEWRRDFYRLHSITDRYGNQLELHYGLDDELSWVEDTVGNVIRFHYNDDGRLGWIQEDKGQRKVTYAYDGNGDLQSVTDAAGIALAYTYSFGHPVEDDEGEPVLERHLNHNLRTVETPKGQLLDYTYFESGDDVDKLQTREDGCAAASAGSVQLSYAVNGEWTTVAATHQPTAHLTEYVFDEQGLLRELTRTVTPHGRLTTTWTYNADHLPEVQTTPRQVRTTWAYRSDAAAEERRGDLVSITRAGPVGPTGTLEHVTAYADFGSFGRAQNITVTSLVDGEIAAQHTITRVVDGLGNIRSVRRDLQQVAFDYHGSGLLRQSTNEHGGTTDYEYYFGPKGRTFLRAATPAGLPATKYTYFATGELESVTDVYGVTTRTTKIDGRGRPEVTVVEAGGTIKGTTTFVYDSFDNVVETKSDFDGRPLTVKTPTNCLGLTESRTEEATVEGTARRTGYGYDDKGRLEVITSPRERNTTLGYDERDLVTSVTIEGRRVVDFEYDADGNRTSSRTDIEEGGATRTVTTASRFDSLNRLAETTDPNGNSTRTLYGSFDAPIRTEIFDDAGALVRTVRLTRDAANRVLQVDDVDHLADNIHSTSLQTTRLDYEPTVVTVTAPLGRIHRRTLDQLGRVRVYERPDGSKVTYDYAGVLLTRATDASGTPNLVTNYLEHDEFGRPKTVETGGQIIERVWDDRGNLIRRRVTDGATVEWVYDAFGRLESASNGRQVTQYGYDDHHNLTSLTNGRGVTVVERHFDLRDRLEWERFADSADDIRLFGYRNDDRLTSYADRAGNVFELEHDDGGRLTWITATTVQPGFEGGTVQRGYGYDAQNRLEMATSIAGGTEYVVQLERTGRGALWQETDAWSSTATRTLDGADERINTAYGWSRVDELSFSSPRDGLGRIDYLEVSTSTTDPKAADYSYFSTGRIGTATFGNGVVATRSFTNAWQEGGRTYAGQVGSHTGFLHTYTGAGALQSVRRMHEGGVGDTFGYTAEQWLNAAHLGRVNPLLPIDTETEPGERLLSMTYDAAGNRATWELQEYEDEPSAVNTALLAAVPKAAAAKALLPSVEAISADELWSRAATGVDLKNTRVDFGPDGADRVTGGLPVEERYDANGNLRLAGDHQFEYDPFGQLIRVTNGATGDVVTYEYDGLGRRISRTTSAGTERYLHDGPHQVAVVDGANGNATQATLFNPDLVDTPVLLRVFGPDGESADYYYERDRQGSVVALTDTAGEVVERYRYDPNGIPEPLESAVDNRLMFQSRPFDGTTSVYDFRARAYTAAWGRFLQTDPAGFIDGPNLYTAFGNDPVNMGDPSGLRSVFEMPGMSPINYGDDSAWNVTRPPTTFIPDIRPDSPPEAAAYGVAGAAADMGIGSFNQSLAVTLGPAGIVAHHLGYLVPYADEWMPYAGDEAYEDAYLATNISVGVFGAMVGAEGGARLPVDRGRGYVSGFRQIMRVARQANAGDEAAQAEIAAARALREQGYSVHFRRPWSEIPWLESVNQRFFSGRLLGRTSDFIVGGRFARCGIGMRVDVYAPTSASDLQAISSIAGKTTGRTLFPYYRQASGVYLDLSRSAARAELLRPNLLRRVWGMQRKWRRPGRLERLWIDGRQVYP